MKRTTTLKSTHNIKYEVTKSAERAIITYECETPNNITNTKEVVYGPQKYYQQQIYYY
jgi:hypothetical protein